MRRMTLASFSPPKWTLCTTVLNRSDTDSKRSCTDSHSRSTPLETIIDLLIHLHQEHDPEGGGGEACTEGGSKK